MVIRIIAGEFRGRRLQAVPGRGTRPLLGQVRESIFNILAADIADAIVWDLFAGTGASGIEALSRGAEQVVFVERSRAALSVLHKNLAMCRLEPPRAIVLAQDAWSAPRLHPDPRAPDVVFLDPPYEAVNQDPGAALVRVGDLIAHCQPETGCVVFHFQPGALQQSDLEAGLDGVRIDLRVWGDSAVAFLRRS